MNTLHSGISLRGLFERRRFGMDSEALGIATLSSQTRSFSPTVVRLRVRGLGPYAGNISPSAKLPRPV